MYANSALQMRTCEWSFLLLEKLREHFFKRMYLVMRVSRRTVAVGVVGTQNMHRNDLHFGEPVAHLVKLKAPAIVNEEDRRAVPRDHCPKRIRLPRGRFDDVYKVVRGFHDIIDFELLVARLPPRHNVNRYLQRAPRPHTIDDAGICRDVLLGCGVEFFHNASFARQSLPKPSHPKLAFHDRNEALDGKSALIRQLPRKLHNHVPRNASRREQFVEVLETAYVARYRKIKVGSNRFRTFHEARSFTIYCS